MRIFVDADACPVTREVSRAAIRYSIAAIFITNGRHELASLPGVEIVHADDRAQGVDIEIANRTAAGDIVVTQDVGLAQLVLGRGARALSPRGRVYEAQEMPALAARRHFAAKIAPGRPSHARTGSLLRRRSGPLPRRVGAAHPGGSSRLIV